MVQAWCTNMVQCLCGSWAGAAGGERAGERCELATWTGGRGARGGVRLCRQQADASSTVQTQEDAGESGQATWLQRRSTCGVSADTTHMHVRVWVLVRGGRGLDMRRSHADGCA
jgi:hypothetical protein